MPVQSSAVQCCGGPDRTGTMRLEHDGNMLCFTLLGSALCSDTLFGYEPRAVGLELLLSEKKNIFSVHQSGLSSLGKF